MLILQDVHAKWRPQASDNAVAELLLVSELNLVSSCLQCGDRGVYRLGRTLIPCPHVGSFLVALQRIRRESLLKSLFQMINRVCLAFRQSVQPVLSLVDQQ
jgi:hypothetical protein